MNEIYFNGYGYFKTDADNYDDAMSKFLDAASQAGIEIEINKAELRDEDGEIIEQESEE